MVVVGGGDGGGEWCLLFDQYVSGHQYVLVRKCKKVLRGCFDFKGNQCVVVGCMVLVDNAVCHIFVKKLFLRLYSQNYTSVLSNSISWEW